MAENSSAYSEFESLWQKANNPQKDIQAVEVGVGVKDTDMQVLVLLPQFSQLADSLKSSNIIDSDQYDQMLVAIAKLKEVIQTIDHNVIADVLKSLK